LFWIIFLRIAQPSEVSQRGMAESKNKDPNHLTTWIKAKELYKSVMKLYMHIYYIQSKPLANFTIKLENINDIQDN
jgi:hypothetical protein